METKEDYKRIFAYYDRDKKGYFTYEEYCDMWINAKQKFTD